MGARFPVTARRATTLQGGKGRDLWADLTTARRSSLWQGATGRWNAGDAIRAKTSARLCRTGSASIAIETATRASLRTAAAGNARLATPRRDGSRPASAPPSTLRRGFRCGAGMRQRTARSAIRAPAPMSTTIRDSRAAISVTRTATAGSSPGRLIGTAANAAMRKPRGRRSTIRFETTARAGSHWSAPTPRSLVTNATRKAAKGESSTWLRRPAGIVTPILTSARPNWRLARNCPRPQSSSVASHVTFRSPGGRRRLSTTTGRVSDWPASTEGCRASDATNRRWLGRGG